MHDPDLQRHLRDAIAYDEATLAELKTRNREDDFLPDTLPFYSEIQALTLKETLTTEELEQIWARTDKLLRDGRVYRGIVLAFAVKRIDNFLSDSHPSFEQRSLWNAHSKRF